MKKSVSYIDPIFTYTDVEPIAREIKQGVAQWPKLAQYLQAARSCKFLKSDEFAKKFDGASSVREIYAKLDLLDSTVSNLVKGFELAQRWDAKLVEEALTNGIALPVGSTVLYRASLLLGKLPDKDRDAKDNELQEKFRKGDLHFSHCVMPKLENPGKRKASGFSKAIDLARKNEITEEQLILLINAQIKKIQRDKAPQRVAA